MDSFGIYLRSEELNPNPQKATANVFQIIVKSPKSHEYFIPAKGDRLSLPWSEVNRQRRRGEEDEWYCVAMQSHSTAQDTGTRRRKEERNDDLIGFLSLFRTELSPTYRGRWMVGESLPICQCNRNLCAISGTGRLHYCLRGNLSSCCCQMGPEGGWLMWWLWVN